jgi:hypothetical protein
VLPRWIGQPPSGTLLQATPGPRSGPGQCCPATPKHHPSPPTTRGNDPTGAAAALPLVVPGSPAGQGAKGS